MVGQAFPLRPDGPLIEDVETYRVLLEQVADGVVQDVIAILDTEGKIQFVSAAVEKTLGYVPEELIGRPVFDLLDSGAPGRLRGMIEAGLEKPGCSAGDLQVRHKDGSWRLLAATVSHLQANSDSASILVSARDVTERLDAERQALFHTSLLDHLRSAVIALDADGRISYWNQSAPKLMQWSIEEVLGKQLTEVVIPPDAHGRCAELLRTVQDIGHSEGECPIQRRDGTTFPAFMTFAEVRDQLGAPIGRVVVATDITDLKQAEEGLKASDEQLRKLAAYDRSASETERTRVARDIHDELGQQLTAIKMNLFSVAKELSAKPPTQELGHTISSTVELVDATIASVRRICQELRPSALDDLGLCAAIEWQIQEFQSRSRIRCSFNRPGEEVTLSRDRCTEIFRIFQEVLTNVARHARARTVEVAIQHEDGVFVLNVRDDGVGIAERELIEPGSLGLLGMRERALRLNGEILITGSRHAGTLVSLRVPVNG